MAHALAARVAELEAKLGLPPKTPDNSSLPPSKGQCCPRSRSVRPSPIPAPIDPNPTRHHDVLAVSCQPYVSGAEQSPCETYDRVESTPCAVSGRTGGPRFQADRL